MGNIFGQLFSITTFGESHGPAVGVVIDRCPANIQLDLDQIAKELQRRRTGQSKLVSQRSEADTVEVLSGLFEGVTTGTPLTMMVRNTDAKPSAYDHLKDLYRPSHADYTYQAKYGVRDHRGGGRSSARETTARVIAGAVAKQILRQKSIEVLGWVDTVADIGSNIDPNSVELSQVESNPIRCPDDKAAVAMIAKIDEARKAGDSLGGTVRCIAKGVPVGLGEPVFNKLEADLAKAMLSLPASKGFEIGSGFSGTLLSGSQHNDSFSTDDTGKVVTTTNNSGGIQGGITNSELINMRVAFKPTATIAAKQDTVTTKGEATELEAIGRHDPCVLPRAVPIVEAMAALVLVDQWLIQNAYKTS